MVIFPQLTLRGLSGFLAHERLCPCLSDIAVLSGSKWRGVFRLGSEELCVQVFRRTRQTVSWRVRHFGVIDLDGPQPTSPDLGKRAASSTLCRTPARAFG